MATTKDKPASEVHDSAGLTAPSANGQPALRIFKLWRKSKKTPQNPEAKELLQMTYAQSEEQALDLAQRIFEERYGRPFWVEEVK